MENAEITKEYVQTIMNAKAQPPGALGHVQDVAVQLCVLKQTVEPQVNAAACIIFCGDHGVTKNPPESPSPYPRAVTELMFQTVSNGGAAISTMCRALNIPLTVIDVGIDSPDRSHTHTHTHTTHTHTHTDAHTPYVYVSWIHIYYMYS